MKKSLLLLLTGLAAWACVYPYDEALQAPDTPVLVMDGSIVLGSDARLNVGLMRTYDGSIPQGLRSVEVENWWVEDDKGERYTPAADQETVDLSAAPSDRNYRMVMKVQGKTYSSMFQHPVEPPQIDSVTIWADDTNVYCGLSMDGGPDATGFAAVCIEEIWNFHAKMLQEYDWKGYYMPLTPDDPSVHYWCWLHNANSPEMIIDYSKTDGKAERYIIQTFSRLDNRNHRRYELRTRARTLTQDEYIFLNNISRGNQGSDLFTPNPGEVPGNVRCEDNPSEQVLGYVTVSKYASQTVSLDDRYYKGLEVGDELLSALPSDYETLWYYYYEMQWRPVRDFQPNENALYFVVGWADRRCVDCVYAGGLPEKPEFIY